jgi:NTP pyrophosphatase (non-canonical NTP hydrolase)
MATTPSYTLPQYAALKSPTQEVLATEVPETPKDLPPTSLRQAQTNFLLDKLQEEAAEVIQAVNKIRRFGENNKHPERQTTNKQDLANELEDFLAILAALEYTKYLDLVPHQQNILHKTHKLIV